MEKKSHDIYLSYSRNDIDACNKIIQILRDNGFSVWSEENNLTAGMLYGDAIQNAIIKSKVIIAICSKWSVSSEWIKNELAFAEEKAIPVIRVLTDNPNGLEGTDNVETVLKMGSRSFEADFLFLIKGYGAKADTTKMYYEAMLLHNDSLKDNDLQKEKQSFLLMLRAAELDNKEAESCIKSGTWNIDLIDAINSYKPLLYSYIGNLCEELFCCGELLGSTNNSRMGNDQEMMSFCMMKRAVDLGYKGGTPWNFEWNYLKENDIDECLDKLGLSSRIHLNDERGDYISKFGIKHFTIESKLRKENDEREHQIFISYKRDDSDMVFPIKDKIELNTGIKCWIDLDGIESDAQFVNVIIKAINKADVFLFMYSHSHAEIEDYEKDWTVREISFAQKKNKRIVFVNIDNTPLTDWFEMMFGLQQQVNATSNSAMKRLYRDLKKWLG